MSFALTTEQIRNRTKTVTRRTGWKNLKPGTLLCAVRKGMGLKKGEKIERLCTIRVVDIRREPLLAVFGTDHGADNVKYAMEELEREGVFDHPDVNGSPWSFVGWFAATHKMDVTGEVTRIEFEYV